MINFYTQHTDKGKWKLNVTRINKQFFFRQNVNFFFFFLVWTFSNNGIRYRAFLNLFFNRKIPMVMLTASYADRSVEFISILSVFDTMCNPRVLSDFN